MGPHDDGYRARTLVLVCNLQGGTPHLGRYKGSRFQRAACARVGTWLACRPGAFDVPLARMSAAHALVLCDRVCIGVHAFALGGCVCAGVFVFALVWLCVADVCVHWSACGCIGVDAFAMA